MTTFPVAAKPGSNNYRAAPDVDWRSMDGEARTARIERRARLRSQLMAAGVEQAEWSRTVLPGALAGNWVERGSRTQSGRVVSAEFDSTNNRITALAHGGQVWRADRGALNWTSPNDTVMFRPNGNVGTLLRLTNPERLLVVGDQPTRLAFSNDAGTTYTDSTGGNPGGGWYATGLAARDAAGTEVYFLRTYFDGAMGDWRTKLFASTDRGSTFTDRGFVGNRDQVAIFSPRDTSTTMYLLNGTQLSTITPEPMHWWHARPCHMPARRMWSRSVAGATARPGRDFLYAFYSRSGGTDVYRSLDGGLTWTTRTPAPTEMFGNFSAEASPQFQNHAYVGGVNLYRSLDGAQSWQLVNEWFAYYGNPASQLHADIPNIDVFSNGAADRILISTDGGLYESNDNLMTVTNLSLSGLNVSQYYGSYTQRSGSRHILAGAQDQGLQKVVNPSPGINDFIQTYSGDYAHLTSGNGGVSTWMVYPGFAMLETTPAAPNTNGLRFWDFGAQGFTGWFFLPPIAADPTNGNRAILAGGRIGGGNSNRVVELSYNGSSISGAQDSFDFVNAVTAVAFASDGNTRYAMSTAQDFFRKSGGGSWTKVTNSGLPGNHYFHGNDIVVHPTVPGTIYVAGSGYSNPGVFRSTTDGSSFAAFSTGLPNTMVYDLAISADGQHLFAATELGPYYYDTATSSWVDLSGASAPEQVYWDVDFVDSENTARFSTYGRGIWDFALDSGGLLFRNGFE
ncbi:MAG: hypothetical protein IPK97_14245 [Ahniella sp.]|nr:hypothetical protein [Ahniella sp.]